MKKIIISLFAICLTLSFSYGQSSDSLVDQNAVKIDELRDKLSNLRKANLDTQDELSKDSVQVRPTLIHRLKVLDENITIISSEINKLELLIEQMSAQQEQLTRIEEKLDNLLNKSAKIESIVSSVNDQNNTYSNASINDNNNNGSNSVNNQNNTYSNPSINDNNNNGSNSLNNGNTSYKEGTRNIQNHNNPQRNNPNPDVILSGSYYVVLESQVRKSDARIAQQMLRDRGIETSILKHKTRGWHYLVIDKVHDQPESLEQLGISRESGHHDVWRVPIEYVNRLSN